MAELTESLPIIVLVFLAVVFGLVMIIIEGLNAINYENDYDAYKGTLGEHQKYELRRNLYFQATVVAGLIAIFLKLPSTKRSAD